MTPDSEPASATWPPGVEPSEELQRAFDLVESGEPFVFITGKAGTGKSTFIRALRHMTGRRLAVVAPTGVAALNAGGQTIHSFFRIRPGPISLDAIVRLPRRALYEKLEIVVIDEVSMVRADLMDAVEKFLRENGPDRSLPFGGVQIVAVGDLYQLPPVVTDAGEARLFSEWYASEYFLSAHCLHGLPIAAVELKKVHRQSDPDFIALLNKVREGDDLQRSVAELNRRCLRAPEPAPRAAPAIPAIPGLMRGAAALMKARGVTASAAPAPALTSSTDAVTLTSTNAIAERINEARMKGLDGDTVAYEATVEGTFDATRNPPAPFNLALKVGAQVMFTKNDPLKRWVNGDIGRVTELGEDRILVERLEDPGRPLDVERTAWETVRFTYDEKEGRVRSEPSGAFHQFPLMPAWAVTIHKSQGKTISNVRVDFGGGAFAHGQVYVALSRCRSLEGLRFERPLRESDIHCDERVKDFHASVLGRFFR